MASVNTNASTTGQAPVIDAARAIKAGEMPNNATINQVFDKAKAAIESEKQTNPTLNQGGKQTADKVQNVIEAAQAHLNEKNADGKLQRLVEHTKNTASEVADKGKEVAAQASDSSSKTSASTGGTDMRALIKEIATSSEFRNTLLAALKWLREVFYTASDPNTSTTETLKEAAKGNAPTESIGQSQQQAWKSFAEFMRVIGRNPKYQQAVEGLFMFLDDMGQPMIDATKSTTATPSTNNMYMELRAVLEELAGGKSMEPIVNQVRSIRTLVSKDARLQQFLADARDFFEKILKNPESLDTDAEAQRGQTLINQGINYAKEYRESVFVKSLFANTQEFIQAIRDDPTNQRLSNALKELGKELVVTDPNTGKPMLDTDALAQLKALVIPILREQLAQIPIPTIEGSNESTDYRFENVVLNGYEIVPEHFRIKYDNDTEFNLRDLSVEKVRASKVIIYVSNIKTRLENVKFWYRHNTFPKIEDQGTANISMLGDGLEVRIRANLSSEQPFFTTTGVDCDIDKLKIQIVEAKHQTLDKIVTGLFRGAIRKRVETAMEEKLQKALVNIQETLNKIAARIRQGGDKLSDKVLQAAGGVLPTPSGSSANPQVAANTQIHA